MRFIVIQIFIMSILLIGQKNPIYYSPQISKSYQMPHYLRQKKIKQDKYRLELLDQIRQKKQKARKQRQIEEQQERRYQAKMRKIPPESVSYSSNHQRNNNNYHFLDKNSIEDEKYTTPINSKSNKNIFSPTYNYDFSHLNTKKRHSRVKTQNLSSEPYKQFTESYEKRKVQLQEYENKKIGEVYEKMYNSVQILNEEDEQQYELIKSRFKPIKLNIDYKKNRNKYIYTKRPQANPQEQFYKLPRIIKYNSPTQLLEESNWRQWYAKQKLKELENYYKKKLIDNQIRQQMQNESRARTPAFR